MVGSDIVHWRIASVQVNKKCPWVVFKKLISKLNKNIVVSEKQAVSLHSKVLSAFSLEEVKMGLKR